MSRLLNKIIVMIMIVGINSSLDAGKYKENKKQFCPSPDFANVVDCISSCDEEGALEAINQCKPNDILNGKIEEQNIIIYCIHTGVGDDVIEAACNKLKKAPKGKAKSVLKDQIQKALQANRYKQTLEEFEANVYREKREKVNYSPQTSLEVIPFFYQSVNIPVMPDLNTLSLDTNVLKSCIDRLNNFDFNS